MKSMHEILGDKIKELENHLRIKTKVIHNLEIQIEKEKARLKDGVEEKYHLVLNEMNMNKRFLYEQIKFLRKFRKGLE